MAGLQERYAAVHREAVELFERTAAAERHWLMYALLGMEMLAACLLSHYLIEIAGVQERWPYVLLWLVQIFVAIATVKLVTGRPQMAESPLEPRNKRLWLMFLFLSINVAVLNVVSGRRIFEYLPMLAVLSSSTFTALATFVSPRLSVAGLAMFATGLWMAYAPAWGFVIYGLSWFVILESLAAVFFRKRRKWG